ncbi:methyl-accepting chemotaxis protein [Aliamphritea ceti]|uniref:methyl-accepting chemotaxis protein n=1 Tax=Aliamphritea ceti TaxID=1524258 RepID=UPI0021C49E9F|nr:methyl-accepting chemotaxis protein [Aliamphritea ceti]
MLNRIKDLSIKNKINALVLILMALLVLISGFGTLKIDAISGKLSAISSEEIPLAKLFNDVTISQLHEAILIERAMRGEGIGYGEIDIPALGTATAEIATQISDQIAQGQNIITELRQQAVSSDGLEVLAQQFSVVEAQHQALNQQIENFYRAIDAGESVSPDESAAIITSRDEINRSLADLLLAVNAMTETAVADASQTKDDALQGMLVISLISVLIGLLLGTRLSRAITKPLSEAVLVADKLAEGDLTVRLKVSARDETGQLLQAMNKMTDHLLEMINAIASASGQLTEAGNNVTTISGQTSANVQQQKDNLQHTAVAMEQMTSTVREVAESAQLAAGSATEADNEARQGRAMVGQVNTAIEALAGDIEKAREAIMQLNTEASNVGNILDVITDVADQTNLLALNAAIEAARAGDHGRGFAVVADEVRTLASRTQESTVMIQQLIESLQSKAGRSADAMQQGTEKTRETVELAQHAEQSLTLIGTAVERINDMNLQIASAAEQQSSTANEINRSVNEIHQLSESTYNDSRQVETVSGQVAELTADLRGLVAHFKT